MTVVMSSGRLVQQSTPTTLCAICRTIPFDGVILPFIHEVEPSLRPGKTESSGFFSQRKDRGDTRTIFPSMSHTLKNEAGCGFCALIGNVLRTHQTSPYGPKDRVMTNGGEPYYENLPAGADRPFQIRMSLFHGFNHPDQDASKKRALGRFKLRWQDDLDSEHGAFFCFQTMGQSSDLKQLEQTKLDPFSHNLFCGGRQRPLDIDLDWIRHWIRLCVHSHNGECKARVDAPIRNGAKIRLINVKKMCIDVDINPMDPNREIQYLALSYVWGADVSKRKQTLSTSNLADLQNAGSLTMESVPATIADLIYLAQKLEITHIWVDALCIVQDDREDKIVQIGIMNAIYQHAFITVVAAGSGDNADAGLPGLRSGTRSKTAKEVTIRLSDLDNTHYKGDCDYITLMESLVSPEQENWTALTSTVWRSRAWTFQERMLSRRVLVFTQEQLYWSCNEGNYCEEAFMEIPQRNFSFHTGFTDPMETSFYTIFRESTFAALDSEKIWMAFKNFVMQYSRRHLSFEGDYHAAFTGMMTALSLKTKDEFLLGQPRSRFEHGLAWTNFRPVRRRTEMSALPMTSKGMRIIIPSWTWMGWVGEVVINVTQQRENDGARPEVECFTHRTSPLRLVPARALRDHKKDETEIDWVYISNNGPTLEDIAAHHPSLTVKALEDSADETILFFWASASRFQVNYPDLSTYGKKELAHMNNKLPEIIDDEGNVVGELRHLQKPPFQDGEKAEFVVIERQTWADPVLHELFGSDDLLTVIQIGWRIDAAGSGVCKERINLGTIKERDWLKSKPERKLIALQ